ncbi:MAG: CcmD family protein [Alicyclobacillus macrosporangiidus]|uniref:CcmD family protein n=1 Tax=Alicyclobacillus macrosporangiidus TaxID=392015 RepID=UPI0026EAAA3B|nr:CcmD family protein [Alicyclobacillus macrosporangiidus]MCL6600133.1 CcmD family protein [Alicyclobacillus macrosporangiidus]
MQHLGYLWAVSAVVWGGTLIYVFTLLRRQNRLQAELERLKKAVEDWKGVRSGGEPPGTP